MALVVVACGAEGSSSFQNVLVELTYTRSISVNVLSAAHYVWTAIRSINGSAESALLSIVYLTTLAAQNSLYSALTDCRCCMFG